MLSNTNAVQLLSAQEVTRRSESGSYLLGVVEVLDGGASDFFFLPFFFGAGASSPPANETETAPKASDRPSINVINFLILCVNLLFDFSDDCLALGKIIAV